MTLLTVIADGDRVALDVIAAGLAVAGGLLLALAAAAGVREHRRNKAIAALDVRAYDELTAGGLELEERLAELAAMRAPDELPRAPSLPNRAQRRASSSRPVPRKRRTGGWA